MAQKVKETGAGSSGELLRRLQNGDTGAFEALIVHEVPFLRRWASRRLPRWARGVADTVDLVQDVVANTLRRRNAIDVKRQGALQAYLRQAIQNRVRDEVRAFARRPLVAPLDSAVPTPDASPLEEAVDAETARRYRAALAQLRPTDRDLIVGRIELGYSYEKLAVAAGRPTAESARLAVRRALLRLADEMGRHLPPETR